MGWKYEPDETPKRKHAWSNDTAGFVDVHGVKVGKCPKTLTIEHIQQMLDGEVEGAEVLEWRPASGWRFDCPKRLYLVYEGVVYRAMPTRPGFSYHGFPESDDPDAFPKGRRGRELKERIIAAARQQGCEAEVRKWMSW